MRSPDWRACSVTGAFGLTLKYLKCVATMMICDDVEAVVHVAGRLRVRSCILNGYLLVREGCHGELSAAARAGIQWWVGARAKCFLGKLQDRFVLSVKKRLSGGLTVRPTLIVATDWSQVGLRLSVLCS